MMKNRVIRFIVATVISFLLLTVSTVVRAASYSPVLNIVPSSTAPLTVSQSGTSLNYTVTNLSTSPATALTLHPGYNASTALLSTGLFNDQCSGVTLTHAQSCTFSVSLISTGVVGSTQLSPQVCQTNRAICSIPVVTNRVSINTTTGGTAPSVQSISPTQGPITGGTTVTISGQNLGTAGAVTFGGVPATILSNLVDSIVVRTPAGSSIGSVPVVVNTVSGAATSPQNFTYNPIITATAGAHGSINPSGTIEVAYNGSQAFTATPASGYTVDTWQLDGALAQTGGTAYTVSSVTANHTVQVLFKGLPSRITATSGGGQTASISTQFSAPLVATVVDVAGQPVVGATVTFTAPASGASGTFANTTRTTTATTNAQGVATSSAFTANATSGTYTVIATVSGVSGSAAFSLTNIPYSTITVTSGNNQTATVNTAYAAPLSVTLTSGATGAPLAGVTVTFTVTSGDNGAGAAFAGSATTTAVTDSAGVATTSATLTANTVAGAFTVVASASSVTPLTATFNLTNTPGTASLIAITTGGTQSITVGQTAGTNLGVTVYDEFLNPVSGQTVTFTAPGSGASGTFAPYALAQTSTVTASDGTASVLGSNFTANNTVGAYNVVATAGSGTANFSFTNIADTTPHLAFTTGTLQNQVATVNTTLASPYGLSVTVTDGLGHPLANVPVSFTSTDTEAQFINGSNSIDSVTTDANGVVAPAYTAGTAAGNYTITVSTTGGANTLTFYVVNNPGAAASIEIVNSTDANNQSIAVNTQFTYDLDVSVQDQYGNGIPNQAVSYTVTPSHGMSGTFVSNAGTTLQAYTDTTGQTLGIAFKANTVAGPYTYTVSAAAGSAPSAVFTLQNLAGTASAMTVTAGNNQSAAISQQYTTPLSVTVADTYGNPVSGTSVTFTPPSSSSASIQFAGTNTAGTAVTAITNTAGVATTPLFAANATSGSVSVTTAATGITSPPSFSLTNTDSAAAIAISPDCQTDSCNAQSAILGQSFTHDLSVIVTDSSSTPVSGATVTFTAPGSGASVTFPSGSTATTDASGVAQVPVTANTTVGSYTVYATVTGVGSQVPFVLTNSPDQALTVTSGNDQTALVGAAFTNPLQVQLVNSTTNEPISGATVVFTLSSAGPSATFPSSALTSTVTTNSSGYASSAALTANTYGGTYTVTITSARAASTTATLKNQAITVSESLLMFTRQVTDGAAIYEGTLTINNNSAGAQAVPTATTPDDFALLSTTCQSSLAANSSCTDTFYLVGAITTGSPIVSFDLTDIDETYTVPVSLISVRPLSPPVNPTNNAALMLVAGCTTAPEILEVTNLSEYALTSISAASSGWTSNRTPVITNNCSGLSLAPAAANAQEEGQSCTLAVVPNASAVLADTGTIAVTGSYIDTTLTAIPSVSINAAVEAASAASLPAVGTTISTTAGNEVVISSSSACNIAKIAAAVDQSEGIPWDTATTPITVGASDTSNGQTNTVKAMYVIGTGGENEAPENYAAGLCFNLLENDDTNWYVPSVSASAASTDELVAMLTNFPIGNGQAYWSSTESSLNTASYVYVYGIPEGLYTNHPKTAPQYLRCLRAETY